MIDHMNCALSTRRVRRGSHEQTAILLALCALTLFPPALMPASSNAASAKRVPVIDVTDLYHPPQDPGDNFDLIAAYALPEIELKAVILDVSEAFRHPVARHPGLGEDRDGPREGGFIPVIQLNSIFGRNVPCAVGPYRVMKSPQDKMLDAPAFQQEGIRLLLKTLSESPEPVTIVSFGSARPIAVALNRDPALLRRKVRRIHLSAGASAPGYLEWNVLLDTNAMVCLLRSTLPIALYPCATKEGPFAYGPNNSYWQLPDLRFVERMAPPLRRYLDYALGRSARVDFLRAIEEDSPPETMRKVFDRQHNVWETAIWLNISGRHLVRRAHGSARIVRPQEVRPTDNILPNKLLPCKVDVQENGQFTFELAPKRSNRWIYYRGDARENQTGLREALPVLYEEFKPLRMWEERFSFQGRNAFIMRPQNISINAATGWVWYAPTLPGLPAEEEYWMFERFFASGLAIAGIDVGESHGSPEGRAIYSAFYKEVTRRRGLGKKPVLLGRSRGGLMALAWAVENPTRVGGVAGIYPVCNPASYPGLTNACAAYHMTAEELARDLKRHNPLDNLQSLAHRRVPLFAIHGDNDQVVPLPENSGLMKTRYESLGGKMELLIAPGQGHTYWPGFFQCQKLVDFVMEASSPNQRH